MVRAMRELSHAARQQLATAEDALSALESAFNAAVDEVTGSAIRLIRSLTIHAPPRNREDEARRARERAAQRFG